jgi:hypothetical protein
LIWDFLKYTGEEAISIMLQSVFIYDDSYIPILIIVNDNENGIKEINRLGSDALTTARNANKLIRQRNGYVSIIISTKIDISRELDKFGIDESKDAQTYALRDDIVSIMNRL